MSQIKLVSWVGSEDIESFHPQCSIINRILSYAKIEFTPVTFQIRSEEGNLGHKLVNIPAIIDGEQSIAGYWNVEKYLFENFFVSDLIPKEKDQMHRTYLLHEWAMSEFYLVNLFFIYIKEKNFLNYKGQVLKTASENNFGTKEAELGVDLIRDIIGQKTKGIKLYYLEPQDQLLYLARQLEMVDSELGSKNFLIRDDRPTLADISLFCLINRILLPYFEHSIKLKNKYYRLIRWMERVGTLTSGPNNVEPSHLLR